MATKEMPINGDDGNRGAKKGNTGGMTMSKANIETWQELVDYADATINYPFEEFIERHVSFADSITDVICAAVVIAEDIGEVDGTSKNYLARQMLHAYFESGQWHPFVVKIIDTALVFAIEAVVVAFDTLFPAGWDKLLGLLFEGGSALEELLPLLDT